MKRAAPFLFLLLFACSYGDVPFVTSLYPMEVKVVVRYSDGETKRLTWNYCDGAPIGEPNVRIENVTFENNGKLLREFSAEDIRAMVARIMEPDAGHVWLIGPEGDRLLPKNEKSPCERDNR